MKTAQPNEQGKSGLGGMTLNERLVYAGLLDRWDEAVQRRDRAAMTTLLEGVEVAKPEVIVEEVLANPQRYGF